ncbi:MAG TPA: arginase family protein, partial [Phnomibacter sp.]|nr:arginase family protein [Phnomibacter sp.]
MAFYRKPTPETWSGRIDGVESDQLRWHQVMQFYEPERLPPIGKGFQGIALIGFCCDEGVRRNMGRTGAAAAPEAIRHACCNFPLVAGHIVMADVGDVVCNDGNLEEAQAILAEKIMMINASGFLPIVLGGGHETA